MKIEQGQVKKKKEMKQYVTFDTTFHRGMEAKAFTYAIPREIAKERGYRKYGFHGLSYGFVCEALREHEIKGTKVIACHLGTGGGSVAAIQDGHCVDTTMGWSPLPGLVMSTRCGDIDASIALDLVDWKQKQKQQSVATTTTTTAVEDVVKILNNESGLVGITGGVTSDLRDAFAISQQPKHKEQEICKLAFEVYCHRLIGAIGEMMGVLGGVDVLVFTDDLGFDMPPLRQVICDKFAWLGLDIDPELNKITSKGSGPLSSSDTAVINSPSSKIGVVVVVNDEEIVIAREAKPFLNLV